MYTASYAAVPHIVSAIESHPVRATMDYFQLPACIEIARRNGKGPAIPADLVGSYQLALSKIPTLASAALQTERTQDECAVIAAAIVAAKGYVSLAEAMMELDTETIQKVIEHRYDV